MSLATIIAAIFEKYGERPAIGTRAKRVVAAQSTNRTVHWEPIYQTLTYSQLWVRTGHLAASLYHRSTAPVNAASTVAILSFTSADYVTLDLTCIRLGAMTVPLQTGTSLPDLLAILDETRPTLLASSIEQLETAIECIIRTPSIQRMIILDVEQQSSADTTAVEQAVLKLRNSGSQVVISEFHKEVKAGEGLPEVGLDERPQSDDELAMLIYTSGSTGSPKGAMYTQKLAAGMWGGSWSTIFSEDRALTFHYMPMSHVAGHSSLKSTLARGGTCFFTAHATLSTLIEDISLVKPTELSLVPRVCEMIYQKYQGELTRHTAQDGDPRSLEILEGMRMRDLGGRVTWASCSSAPIRSELKNFIERLLGLQLHGVYGSTEAGAIWIDNVLLCPPVEAYKLRDVPELGYYLTDRPYPRGELLLRTSSIIPGYYKRPDLNNELFDPSGYYTTGDIVAEHSDKKLHFVDRRKNIVKLSQGEFVTLARLETIFAGIPDLDSIFIHANSSWSYPLAVIVPNQRLRDRFSGDQTMMRTHLIEAIRETAKTTGLRSFEIPRDFVLASDRFTQENGMLSDHGKPLWAKLRQRYGARLENLHETIRSNETRLLQEVHQIATQGSAIEGVLKATQTVLGLPAETIGPDMHFRDLGGDSISALTLSSLLSDAFAIAVPVDLLISPSYDLQHVANYIEAGTDTDSIRPTANSTHGKDATLFHAAHLKLDQFISPQILSLQKGVGGPKPQAKTVLLTGATGFLGRFLCLDILERARCEGGKVICIVRGKNSKVAQNRLLSAFGGTDSPLGRRVAKLDSVLEVVAGDIGAAHLGLDADTWSRMAKEVDRIIHCGALVNHLLPYASLFDANVNSTAQLIELALTHHQKPVSFMSTIAVSTLLGEDPKRPLDESQDIRHWGAVISAQDTYAAGYGLTKWAGEVLLREANEHFGLPVTVYRPSMILAHSNEPGHLNLPDMFTRLLISLAATGLAPESFYMADATGSVASAHYDGLPVDFTSASIVKTSLNQQPHGYRSFNLVNHHDDGVSLDSVVAWLRASDVEIHTINDYSEWVRRFEHALRGLPDRFKTQSILPIIHGLYRPSVVRRGSTIPSDEFQRSLACGQGYPTEVGRLTKSLIDRYVSDLLALGLLSKNTEHKNTAALADGQIHLRGEK